MGLVAVALVAGRGVAGSEAAPADEPVVPPLVRGEVTAEGGLVGADSTAAAGRTDDGTYLVVVDGATHLSVASWEAVAQVMIRPVAGGVSVVTFTAHDGSPVDTGFTFLARP